MKRAMKVIIAGLLPAILLAEVLAEELKAAPPAAALEAAPPSSGLIGWWRAEGNALDSAGAHNGTLPYGMNYGPGKAGQAFDFDGNSRNRVSIPDSPAFKLTEALTIEGWIYPRQYGGMVFFRGDNRAGFDPYFLDLFTPGNIAFSFDTPQNQRVSLRSPIQLNQWQHIAATLGRRGYMRIYVNGAPAAETNTTLRPLGDLDPAQEPAIGIGNHGGTSYQYPFNGLIDEIVLYSRALSQREIQAIFNAGSAGKRPAPVLSPTSAELALREIRYDGQLSDNEARFTVELAVEATGKDEAALDLFNGDLALLPPFKLPSGVRIDRDGNQYRLFVSRPGRYQFQLELVAKITRAEPWNRIEFRGPPAAIASVTAQAAGQGVELQLLSGTALETAQTNDFAHVKGFLAADQTLALRWQSRAAEVTRKALATADTAATAQITPTVIKYSTQIRYDIIQGKLPKLTVALPATHALTRVAGEQIRDWQVSPEGDRQVLSVEFIRPLEKAYQLTIFSEQTVESTPFNASLSPPQPLEVERESGGFTVSAEDVQVEIDSASGLRRVNATEGALAAYRFSDRPLALALKLKRIEPVVNVADRVGVRLEETRLLVSHSLALTVEKAGIYNVELTPDSAFIVADVRGEGVEDWKVADGKLRVNFSSRVLGQRKLDVQLEQALKQFPDQITIAPLRMTGAAKETAQIGAAPAPGIQLKTSELSGLREVPVTRLTNRTDELLACLADQGDWKLTLACQRLAARIVADIFNLVTIGDGLVGGSATIRYGLINQGVQEFRVKIPAHWKNVEFTGPNIRRKEQVGSRASKVEGREPDSALDSGLSTLDTNYVTWTITLQDKAWAGYTLVVTYDFQFDPKGATLPAGGIHTLDTERETGSVAITTAANLQLNVRSAGDPLRRVDEAEMSATDRALITRPVLLAYQYTGDQYDLAVDVKRYDEVPTLSAVADRTQLTTVLTEAGESLTQASFMVKNNDKQYQRFKLPGQAKFWSCYVNSQPAKPERDSDWLLVPLPRGANRDEAFAVDIVYAETNGPLKSLAAKSLQLTAPHTDVPNTYAEWELYVPTAYRLSGFGGSMSVARGTTYGLRDAWQAFVAFYARILREGGFALLVLLGLATLLVWIALAWRRRIGTLVEVLVVIAIVGILAAMSLPSMRSAKERALSISAMSNLRQIGVAALMFAQDNNGLLPASFEQMQTYLRSEQGFTDPESGLPFIYMGNGLPLAALGKDSVLAYSPTDIKGRTVLFADGHSEVVKSDRFNELARRGFIIMATEEEKAQTAQLEAVRRAQGAPPVELPAQPPPAAGPYRAGGFVAGGGGFGGGTPVPAAKPMAAGIRSIRIDIPRTGQAFVFTKVLNVRDEPLSIRARIMELKTFQKMRTIAQVAVFLVGLFLSWWQWRRAERSTFLLTVGLALMIGSVCNLLIGWRTLHWALIAAAPVVALLIVIGLLRKFWPRRPPSGPKPPIAGEPNIPPVVASIALALCLGTTSLSAAPQSSRGDSQSAIGSVSIVSANYTGTVNERVARLDVALRIVTTKPGQRVALFGDDVAVEQFSATCKDARLIRDGRDVTAVLPQKGEVTLHVKLLVKVGGDVSKRLLSFRIPGALTSLMTAAIDQPEADVEFPSAVSFQRTTTGQQTRVEATIASGERIELRWTPRMKRAAEIAPTVICHNASLVTFGGGVVNTRATLDYQAVQGELHQLRVRLPATHRLLRVEGESIRTWEVRDEGGPVLAVELIKGIAPAYRLTVETETALGALPATVNVETPHALDVKRETGIVALRGDEYLELSVESAGDLQRVDAEEFARASGQNAGGVFNAFRFLKPEFALRVGAAAVQPQIEAQVHNHVIVGAEQVGISAVVNYTIKRAGVFSLKLSLPAGYRVETVGGDKILQWAERVDAGMPVLEVTLKERTGGVYALRVDLVRHFKELPKTLAIGGVQPQDTQKLTGFISVSAEPGVAVKAAAFDGLTEIPVATLEGSVGSAMPTVGASGQRIPLSGSALAFKFVATEPQTAPSWKLEVATETLEAWVRAEIANTFTVTETLVSGRALVRYDIQNAPTKELRLRIPAAFKNVEIMGANIRRRDQDGDQWRVEFQNKIRGFHTLTVTWEQPRAEKTSPLDLAGVSAENVERETGLLAIVARPPLQVTEAAVTNLLQVDTRDWPEWAGRPAEATVLAYRYLRPGYTLALDAKRFEEAEVLQALVENVQLSTVVADDGQIMTVMSLAVRNNGRQYLAIGLPPGTTNVWSAFVAGQAVRPGRQGDKLMIPLERSGADGAPVSVELTYVGTHPFPQRHGVVVLESPQLDLPLKNARWELFLPPDYDYADFRGTMKPERVGVPERVSFSFAEYAQKEIAKKAQQVSGWKSEVSRAKGKLARGEVKAAYEDYNRALNVSHSDKEGKDLRELGDELRRIQGSNLLQAQSDFSAANAPQMPSQVAGPQQRVTLYDNAAAEAQWTKLQQAQEAAVAKVMPLHVNLPTRGLRQSFTQVLQTELGKPMTVQMTAVNTKSPHWFGRLAWAVGGFLVLWILVVAMARRRGDTKHAA